MVYNLNPLLVFSFPRLTLRVLACVPPPLTPIALISLRGSCHCENMICGHQTADYTLLHSHHALSPPYGPTANSLAYR